MKPHFAETVRRSLSLFMATLFVALSVSATVLDSRDQLHGPAFESEHLDGVCQAHDHSICTQLGSRQLLAAAAASHPQTLSERTEPRAPEGRRAPSVLLRATRHSRAPPVG